MASTMFVNNLLSSLGLVEVIRNQHRITIPPLSELLLVECRRSWGGCFVGHEVGWLVCSYRLGCSLADNSSKST